jgi:hypothetical protein
MNSLIIYENKQVRLYTKLSIKSIKHQELFSYIDCGLRKWK